MALNNRKRRAAAAAHRGVRIVDFEFGADQPFIEPHSRAVEEGKGDGVRHHGVGEDCVVLARFVGQLHFIHKAGAAAALHGDAEFEGVFALLGAQFVYALYGGGIDV